MFAGYYVWKYSNLIPYSNGVAAQSSELQIQDKLYLRFVVEICLWSLKIVDGEFAPLEHGTIKATLSFWRFFMQIQ